MSSQTLQPPLDRRPVTTDRILVAFLILLALAASWHWVSSAIQTWYLDRNWSHGFLILPLAGYLLWLRRDELKGIEFKPSWYGAAFTVVCTAVYLWYYHCCANGRGRWGAWLLVFAIPMTVFGFGFVRIAWPALLYTLLAVPLSANFDMQVATPLRKISTTIAGFFLSLIPGMGLEVQGVSLQLRAGNATASLEVEDACSGFTYLMAVLALGMFMAFQSRRALWQQVLITVSALPIALLTNAARIVLMGLVCLAFGPGAIGPAYHEWWGLAILPLALGLLVLECGVLEKYFERPERQSRRAAERERGRASEPQKDSGAETLAPAWERADVSASERGERGPASSPTDDVLPARQAGKPDLLCSPIFWTTAAVLLLGAVGDFYFRGQRRAAEEARCIVPARTEPLRKPLAELKSAVLSPFRVVMAQPLSDGTVRLMGSTDAVQLTLVDEQAGTGLTVNLIYYTSVGYIKTHLPEGCLPAVGYQTVAEGENLYLPMELPGTGPEGLPGRLAVFANDELHRDQRAYTLMVNRQNGWFVANQQEANARLVKDGYLANYLQIVIYAPGPDGQREAFLRSAQRLLRVLLPVLEKEFLPIGDRVIE